VLLALEKLVLVLRDGRKLVGVLRSWDQFGMYCMKFGYCGEQVGD